MQPLKQIGFGVLAVILSAMPFFAFANGGQGSGGGDLCEDRIHVIRDNIKDWIHQGGTNGLTLPAPLTKGQYEARMLLAIAEAKVKCVGPKDKGFPVQVYGSAKTCRFDRSKHEFRITCDFTKFNSASESDQYTLVHHEFAGLAQIENPNKADSNYQVSNQISGRLKEKWIKVLAVDRPNDAEDILPATMSLFDQPLTAMTLDSIVTLDQTHWNLSEGLYQHGQTVDRVDDSQPYCMVRNVALTINGPPLLQLAVAEIRAFRVVSADQSNKSHENWTAMTLTSDQGVIDLTCVKNSKNHFMPISIAEAQEAIGSQLSFDSITAKRVFSPRSYAITYPADYIVTPWDMIGGRRGQLKLNLPLVTIQKMKVSGSLEGFIQDGKNVAQTDDSRPYCLVQIMDERRTDLIGKALNVNLIKITSGEISSEVEPFMGAFSNTILRGKLSDGAEIAILFSSPQNARPLTLGEMQTLLGQQATWVVQ